MHVLLLPLGSAGDVHPFIGLGLALAERGHRITCAVNGYFRDLAEQADFEFVEQGTREEYVSQWINAEVWPPPLPLLERYLRMQYETVMRHSVAGETLIVAPVSGFGARIAQLKWDVPLATMHLQPSTLWSDYDSPFYTGTFANRLPRNCKRVLFRLAERFVDRNAGRVVNPLLQELGLPSLSRTIDWWQSSQCVLGAFPGWFASPQPDWPVNFTSCEFPLWDQDASADDQPELEQFLCEGPPPLVFTPGTYYKRAGFFFHAAAEACQRMGRRGVFLTRLSEQIPSQLPAGVRHFDYVPLSRLLPQAAAIVHHGGIGTSAQALRAGIPQLIMPLHTDQPDNALRLKQLGVAQSLLPRRFTGPRVAGCLQQLLSSTDVSNSCAAAATRFVDVDPFAKACRVLETYAARRGLMAAAHADAQSIPC